MYSEVLKKISAKNGFDTYDKASYKKAGETYGCNRSNLQ